MKTRSGKDGPKDGNASSVADYLLDSNVVVDHLRGDHPVTAFVKSLDADQKYYSTVTEIEVYAGARDAEIPQTDLLFSTLTRLVVDEPVVRAAVRYLKKYGKSHGVDLPDAVIAATAYFHGLVLVTKNVKHFPMADIRLQSPLN